MNPWNHQWLDVKQFTTVDDHFDAHEISHVKNKMFMALINGRT